MSLFFTRTFRSSLQNIARNRLLSLAILGVTTIALLALQISLATNLVTDSAIALVHKQIDLSIELRPGAQDFQIDTTLENLKETSFVRDAVFVSKEDALDNFRVNHPEIASFLDEYGIENPLPNTIFVLTHSPENHPSVLNFLEQPEYAQVVDTSSARNRLQTRTRTARLVQITAAVKTATLFFTLLLLILGVFTIYNTIKIALHSRQNEREIMTLVGASPAFMRAPYLWEGILFGIGGAFLATLLFALLLRALSSQIAAYLAQEPLLFTSSFWMSLFPDSAPNLTSFFGANWLSILLLTILAGMLFGLFSSWLGTLHKPSQE